MLIAATGDIHSPRYYEEFVKSVDMMQMKPDLFLMVGDMIDRGNVEEYDKIYNVLFGKIKCPIIACFGNNEYGEFKQTIKQKYPDIKFLDDESWVTNVGTVHVGVVGTTGSLDTPTIWQSRNIPNIEKIYIERMNNVERQLHRLLNTFRILVMHYAPTYKTLEGENPRFFPNMGSQLYENVIIKEKPNLVIHGHCHRGKGMAWIDSVPVLNVSFPLNRGIVMIDTDKLKPGLTKFL